MNVLKCSLGASLLAACFFTAPVSQATVVQSSSGDTTTWVENFDAGSSFTGDSWGLKATYVGGHSTGDLYVHAQNGGYAVARPLSFSFDTLSSQEVVSVDFWFASVYTKSSPPSQTVSLDGMVEYLCGSALCGSVPGYDWRAAVDYNPGPGTEIPLVNQFASFTWTGISQGTHTLTFATAAQAGQTMSIDDVQITASKPPQISAVPEPATTVLFLSGLGLVGLMSRRKSSSTN